MELILVRHGQPGWTTADGRNLNDPELTPLGHQQAQLVGARLADSEDLPARGDVDRLCASPAVRAQQTAAPIASALDLPIETHPWLLELQMPDAWDGAPAEEIEAAFAGLGERTRDEWWEGLPGGESLRDFHRRITTGLTSWLDTVGVHPVADGLWDLDDRAAGSTVGHDTIDRVVAVAHGGTNSAIIAFLLGAAPEPWEWDRFAMGHASVAVLATKAMAGHHIWSLRALGDANHLAPPDRTY